MKPFRNFLILSTTAVLLFSCSGKPAENHVNGIVQDILETRRMMEAGPLCSNGCIFISVWDFDGTIIKGDCTEGLTENGREIFRGLARSAIEAGFSKKYGKGEFEKFWKDYKTLEEKNHTDAYTFLAKIFAGAEDSRVRAHSASRFQETMKNYYFLSSVEMMGQLSRGGVVNYIVSASPLFFVLGSSKTIGVPEDRISGIETEIQGGLLTDRIVPPVNYAEGKVERIKKILDSAQREAKGKKVILLAGFGNSYHTDGPFLKWIHERTLSSGHTVSVMINGGETPPEYKGLFTEVDQDRTAGGM